MKADKLPPKLERFIGAITTSTRAADAAPTGAVNVAEYLDASRLRMLEKLARKGGQTPRQFLKGILARLTRPASHKAVSAS